MKSIANISMARVIIIIEDVLLFFSFRLPFLIIYFLCVNTFSIINCVLHKSCSESEMQSIYNVPSIHLGTSALFKTTGINTLFLFSRTDICANCNSKLRGTLSENFSSIIAKTTSALSIFRFRATLIFEPISFIDGFEIIFAFLMLLKSFSANEILSSEAKI